MARDVNIGKPVETTLKDIHDKLIDVEKKVEEVREEQEVSREVLSEIRKASELAIDNEEVEDV